MSGSIAEDVERYPILMGGPRWPDIIAQTTDDFLLLSHKVTKHTLSLSVKDCYACRKKLVRPRIMDTTILLLRNKSLVKFSECPN